MTAIQLRAELFREMTALPMRLLRRYVVASTANTIDIEL